MGTVSETTALIAEHLENPDTQWSLGTFGGLAEFSRDREEHVAVDLNGDGLSAVTARGGIRLAPSAALRPFASESIGRLGWTHRVSLCLPEATSAMHRRNVFSEIGPDETPLREADRGAVLFDLGLDVLQADLCVRVADRTVAAELRGCVGKDVFDAGNPAMRIILAANPHRVFISRAGRAEVYQPIPAPGGKSPDGPHTHVLPKLLQHRRTHAATEPVPDGFVPCAHFYPRHPIKDALGHERPFDGACHRSFQDLLRRFGAPDAAALKAHVATLVEAGQGPESLSVAPDRAARTAIRITLRQLKAAGPAPHALTRWLVAFDRADDEIADDDPLTLGH
jgi:hypothetical protein